MTENLAHRTLDMVEARPFARTQESVGFDAGATISNDLDRGALAPFVERFGQSHGLSPQQVSLLNFAATGRARKESAALTGCSLKTVEEHWRRIFRKTGCTSDLQVVANLLVSILARG